MEASSEAIALRQERFLAEVGGAKETKAGRGSRGTRQRVAALRASGVTGALARRTRGQGAPQGIV